MLHVVFVFSLCRPTNDPDAKRSSELLLLWLPATERDSYSQAETSQKRSGLCNQLLCLPPTKAPTLLATALF